MCSIVYQKCYREAMVVFSKYIENFQAESMMLSRRWDAHFTYVMTHERQNNFDCVLPDAIEKLWIDGIYVNIRLSLKYLADFLQDELKKTAPFSISSNYTEKELFSLPQYTACRFNDLANFPSWLGFPDATLADILLRIYAFDGITETSKTRYMDFCCKTVQKIMDQPRASFDGLNQKQLSIAVASFAARRLREILLEFKK